MFFHTIPFTMFLLYPVQIINLCEPTPTILPCDLSRCYDQLLWLHLDGSQVSQCTQSTCALSLVVILCAVSSPCLASLFFPWCSLSSPSSDMCMHSHRHIYTLTYKGSPDLTEVVTFVLFSLQPGCLLSFRPPLLWDNLSQITFFFF